MQLYETLTAEQEEQLRLRQQITAPLQTINWMLEGQQGHLSRLLAELKGLRDGKIELRKLLAGAFLNRLPTSDEGAIDPDVLADLHQALLDEEQAFPAS